MSLCMPSMVSNISIQQERKMSWNACFKNKMLVDCCMNFRKKVCFSKIVFVSKMKGMNQTKCVHSFCIFFLQSARTPDNACQRNWGFLRPVLWDWFKMIRIQKPTMELLHLDRSVKQWSYFYPTECLDKGQRRNVNYSSVFLAASMSQSLKENYMLSNANRKDNETKCLFMWTIWSKKPLSKHLFTMFAFFFTQYEEFDAAAATNEGGGWKRRKLGPV